eukprot:m.142043 g.142043  ORF g.142043 m.142043 type:complete len:727 (-) comp30229_c0_seq1:66-2246(-)
MVRLNKSAGVVVAVLVASTLTSNEASAASITMNLFTDNFCSPISIASTSQAYSFDNDGYNPSCSEIFSALRMEVTHQTTGLQCLSASPGSPVQLFAQRYNLFGFQPLSTLYYNYNYSSMEVTSCTETSTTLHLQRDLTDLDGTKAKDCYFLEGTTNDTTSVVGLAEMENFQLFFGLQITFDRTSQIQFRLTSSGLQTYPPPSFAQWSINYTTSGLQTRFSNINGTFSTWVFDPFIPMTTPLIFDGASNPKFVDLVAYRVKLMLPSSSSSQVTLELERDIYNFPYPNAGAATPSCSLSYTLRYASGTGARDWGDFFKLEEADTVTGILERASITLNNGYAAVAPSGCALDLKLTNHGCMDKCTQGLQTTSITKCNPFFSCSAVPYITRVVSTYPTDNSDCVCGEMSNTIDLSHVEKYGKVLTSQYGSTSCFSNFTISSGKTLGVSAAMDSAYVQQWGIGTIIGMVVAFMIMVALVIVCGLCLQEQMVDVGKVLTSRYTTPLHGVQIVVGVVVFLCVIGGVWSSELVTFPKAGVYDQQDETFGLFRGVFWPGVASQGPEPFPCMFYIENDGFGVYDFNLVNTCNAARGTAVMSVFTTFGAVVFLFFHYGNIAAVLEVSTVLLSAITLGTTGNLIENFFNAKKGYMEMNRGTGTYFFAAVFFFAVCQVITWAIDKLSSETVYGTDDSTFRGATKSTTREKENSTYEDESDMPNPYEDKSSTVINPVTIN